MSETKTKEQIIVEKNKVIADLKKQAFEAEADSKKTAIAGIRAAQALCLGLFTLGISMGVGDVGGAYNIPVSSPSITTTLFGGFGSIICEVFARLAEKW